MNHKLIVFDWNGTILADTAMAWRAGNECLKFYGVEPISLKHYRETFTFPIIHFYAKNGLSIDQVLEKKDEGNEVFLNAYEPAAQTARTRKGTAPLLDWIIKNKFGCIILSNYQTDKIEQQLERLGLAKYFHHISAHDCGGTTILQQTTKVERLSTFMAKRRYQPEDTVIIGDSHEEPEIARHLGLTSIGITGGTISDKRLRKAKPDYIVRSLNEVRRILEEVF